MAFLAPASASITTLLTAERTLACSVFVDLRGLRGFGVSGVIPNPLVRMVEVVFSLSDSLLVCQALGVGGRC